MTLLTFLLGSLTVTLTVLLFLIYLFIYLLFASIYSAVTFPTVSVSVSNDFPSYSQQDVPFYCIVYNYYRANWDGLRDHLRYAPW